MASFNRIVLMGNITKAPDIRSIPGSNTTVARTGIAVNRKYKEKEDTMFIDVVAFGRNAEVMGEYITKGSPILIEGRLSMNSWEQDGVKRVKHEVIIDSFQMVGSKRDRDDSSSSYRDEDAGSGATSGSKSSSNSSSDMIEEDDVPF